MTRFLFEPINWSPFLGGGTRDVGRLVRAAAQAGFECISFDTTLLEAWRAQGGSLAALRRHVEDEGLTVPAVHSIALGEDAKAARVAAEPLAEAAHALGAGWVHAGGTAPLGPALIESTHAAASILRAANAALAVEFLPFLPIASIADARAMIAGVGGEAAGAALVVDTWHCFHGPDFATPDGWATLASLRADEIAYVQFDDHPPLEDGDLLEETTQRRVLPGAGVFPLARFVETIRRTGFDGLVGLEHLSAADRDRPVEDVARAMLAASSRYWR